MTDNSAKNLETLFDDADFHDEDVLVDAGSSQDPPAILVFLLPGIRSDRSWAFAFTHRAMSPTARLIITEVVTGPSDLGVSDLALRYRIKSFKNDYLQQIDAAISKHASRHGEIEIAFICHSMGSAIFSEIFESVEDASLKATARIKYVIFLGSIARRTSSSVIGRDAEFINDIGQKDFWPIGAWFLNPWRYDPVGRFGFARATVTDRVFEINNHTSCTEMKHLEDWIVPIIEDDIVRMSSIKESKTYYNIYRAFHKLIWIGVPLFSLIYILY